MSKLQAYLQAPVIQLIEWISWPLWMLDLVRRNKTLQRLLIYYAISSTAIIYLISIEAWLTAMVVLGQMALQMVMMIGQFVVLFTFLSSTKTIELYPGDEGLFTFENDYFGNEVLVEAVQEWMHSLSAEGKAHLDEMGAEAIHGLLLEGPPGTGKTLLAQCLASAVNAAFFGTSGTDYQAMFVGVGPMKIMRMYSKARNAAAQYGAAIVFIDEIDAIGGNRGGVSGGGNNRNSFGGLFGGGGLGVLSKLLTELDGVKEMGRRFQIRNALRRFVGIQEIAEGLVITIAATNRINSLDPALIRPGRIDKIIKVPSPDKTSRRAIIEGYLGKVLHDAESMDIQGMVDDMSRVTPAQISSIIQRSAPRYALNDKRLYITQQDIDAAMLEDIVGLANPIQDWAREQKKEVAIHEAGHAVIAWIVRNKKRITHVSIVRRGGGALGFVRDVDEDEVFALPLSDLSANIMVSLAGYYAVSEILGEPWSGADSDFENVRRMLRALAMNGRFGGIPFQLGPAGNDPFVSERIRKRADDYLQEAIKGTKALINENRSLILKVAGRLMREEEFTSRRFYEIVGGREYPPEASK